MFASVKFPASGIKDSEFSFALFNRTTYNWNNYFKSINDYAPYRSQAVAVSPTDESVIYYGNSTKMKKLKLEFEDQDVISTTLLSVNKVWHDDIHYLKFASDNESIWMAHDGGIAIGSPENETGVSMTFNWQNHYKGLGVSNLNHMAQSERKPERLLYGAQDTGCALKTETENWKVVHLGDGYAVKFHPTYPDISFVSTQGDLKGSLNNGANYYLVHDSHHGFKMNFNQVNNNILYNAGEGIKELTFTDLPNSLAKTTRNLSENQYPNYECYNVWAAPNDENVVYANLKNKDDGFDHLLVRSTNANAPVADIVWENLYTIGGWVDVFEANNDGSTDLLFPKIAIDDEDPLKCWILASAWGTTEDKFFLLEDNTWSLFDPERKLGIIRPKFIVHQYGSNDRIYVGTDRGVYYTEPSLDIEWVKLNGLPHAQVEELLINNCAQKIRVATMVRGVWEADVIPLEQETLITENQEWSQTRVLGNSIRIQSGVRLKIKAEVQIPENQYIYVEKGAELIIDGGHLHNVCGKEWAGIFVEGDDELPQGNLLNSA